jgi:replicative DNA helicase
MSAIVRRDHRTKGTRAVFLDHIQVLSVGKDIREGLTRASIAIRQTVTETNIPHVVLAHINREGSKGRPTAENIKEFDQLHGDCDGMAILWTDADKTKIEPGEMLPMKVFFAKNRNGPTGEDSLLFDGSLMAFRNADKDTPPQEPRQHPKIRNRYEE